MPAPPRPDSTTRFRRLVTPHASITGPSERRRARVTLALLLVLLVLGGLDLTASLAGVYGPVGYDTVIEAVGVTGLILAYVLARRRHVTAAVALAVAVIQGLIWHFRIDAPAGPGETAMLYFLAVPIVLSGLLLRPRPALALAVATILGAVFGEAYLDQQTGQIFGVEDFGIILLLTSVALLSISAAAMYERDAQLLHEATALLKQVTDSIPEVFFVVAPDFSRSYYTSHAYETVWGRRIQDYLSDPMDWVKGVHPQDLAHVQASLAAHAQGPLEFRIVQPSGAVRHIRSRTFPVLDADGKVTRLVGLAEDVTDAAVAQQALGEAQRQRIHLLQQLAHDLASPLSPVKIQLHILKDRVAPEGQKALAIVQRNIDHIQRLVEDVKDVARVEGGGLKVDRKPADLAALVRQAVDTLASSTAERQVGLVAQAPQSLPVSIDSGRITQVMYNLVGNALKFTPPHGRIDVQLTAQGSHAEVQVRDSGKGMRPDQVARLFQPFVQVHDAGAVTRPEDKGTGLGLYISKGIVEAHGGTIAASSDGPGLGSTFTFRLPVA